MNDTQVALLELRRDPLFHLIPLERHSYYVEEAIKRGKASASLFQGKSIRSLFQEHGVKVSISQRTNVEKKFQVRAEFIQKDGQNEVILYEDSLRQLEDAWNHSSHHLIPVSYEEIENIHLAHEFHHFLEYNVLSPVKDQLEPVVLKSIFGRKKERPIRQASEIASHAFAKEFTGFSYFPTLLDIIYLDSIGEMDKEIMNTLI